MHTITIEDPLKLREIINFADKNGCTDQLGRDLIYFLSVLCASSVGGVNADGSLKPADRPSQATIAADFAPLSMSFAIRLGDRFGLCGGWIYAGPGQPADGSAPALSVNLNSMFGSMPKHSWSVHT